MLAVFETHAGGNRAQQICQGLGFNHTFQVMLQNRAVVCGCCGGQRLAKWKLSVHLINTFMPR